MSMVLFMAYDKVFILELRKRYPHVLFLSHAQDILFVAKDISEVQSVWQSVDDIGRVVGLRAYLGKTDLTTGVGNLRAAS